jgi:ribosomal protein S18 acetylase RimI-like enzyme
MRAGVRTCDMRLQALAEDPKIEAWIPAVLPLIHEAGNPYFDWLFGGPSVALPIIESRMQVAGSELSVCDTVVLLDESERMVGGFIALTGADLGRRRTVDAAAYLQRIGRSARAQLLQRMQTSRNLFASVRPDEFYLSKVGVAREARGRGYGRLLVERFLAIGAAQGLDHFVLDVSEKNTAALGLYESLGFRVTAKACTEDGDLTYLTMRLRTGSTGFRPGAP